MKSPRGAVANARRCGEGYLVLVAVALVVVACNAHSAMPVHFLTGNSPNYPLAIFITGVGQGSTRDEAQAKAFASIGAQIDARIESIATHEGRMEVVRSGDDVKAHVWKSMRQQVRAVVSFNPEGVARVVDTYAADQQVFAFAVVDRRVAAKRLRTVAARQSAQLGSHLAAFRDATKGHQLVDMARAYRLLATAGRELGKTIMLLEGISGVPAAPEQVADLARVIDATRAMREERGRVDVEVCVTAAHDFPEGVRLNDVIVSHLNAAGLAATPCGNRGPTANHLRLVGDSRAVLSSDALLQGVTFCTARTAVSLLDPAKNVVLFQTAVESGQTTGGDRDTAVGNAVDSVGEACGAKVNTALGGLDG